MHKKHICISLITLILVFNYSCHQQKSDYVILSGTIKNGNKTIELRSHYDTTDKTKRKIIHLDKNGDFQDTIYIQKEELYVVSDKTNMFEFHLTPSKKYIIEYDTKKFKNEGITLKGDDIDINEYYIDKTRGMVFYDFNESGKPEKEIRSFLNNVKEKQLNRLNISKLPSSLKEHEEASIKFEYLRYLSLYLRVNEINTPSIESKNELDIDYLNEEEYKKYQSYKYLLHDYYHDQLNQKAKVNQKLNSSYSLYQNGIKELALIIPNDYIKNDLIAHNASFFLLNSEDIESCYSDFKKYYTGNDTIIKSKILDSYYRYAKLKKGTPSPKFTNFKNNNGGENSLNDYKGAYVFIDIWATWCGNCYGEMPYLKKLEQEYKDVVFLSIAWKDDESKWRKIIKKESLTGVQLFATKEDNSFFEEYAVNGIPRYILIDPEGNIVDHNTPRPSDDKLKTLFKDVGID
ncbi:TlpA family protein disulfide reductase [Hyunsoonleella flava]|uniref:TlpA family protein disulfide reductase n=1 Tax=Hyunsoonleella flava TaxID=2527939 RepID=A0A4Q9FAM2_9FLAO|nr:TlpA disulfide reductase family protein [Hyunsoonleella flava]TBN00913.1 TlpA family protein disulfide reductase [Hyunsoonleella flava]